MYTLVLILSLKSQFNHNIDLKTVPNLTTEAQCLKLGKKLSDDLYHFNIDIITKLYCEKTQ